MTATCVIFIGLAGSATPKVLGDDIVRWAFLAASVYTLVQAWRIGVTVTPHHVITRGWFRRHTIERSRVVAVRIRQYEGDLVQGFGGGPDAHLQMLRLVLEDGVLDLPEVPGYRRKMTRLSSDLAAALDLPAPSEIKPRHAQRT